MKWELIEDNDEIITERLKVYNGWIIRSRYIRYDHSSNGSVHQVFVLDMQHEWKINKE